MLMKTKGRIKQDRVLTAIVGSYPKPKYIFPKSGRKLLDSFGVSLKKYKKQVGSIAFKKLEDKAALQAIKDQNQANIDLITDGEERRGHYVLDIVEKLNGVNSKKLKRIAIRGNTVQRDAPIINGKITYAGKIVVDEFLFTKTHAKYIAKIGLPGPTTVVDCVANEYYKGDKKRLAFDYSNAIRHEVGALIKAGCRVVQFDDPVLLRFPQDAKSWGLKALENCFAGYENQATFIVHICRGYPNKPFEKKGIIYKANKDYYKDILKWFSTSKLDAVSIEGAQSKLDLSILPAIGKKSVMLGVLDVGDNKVETVKSLVERCKEALKYIPKEQLIISPDCGMIELGRTAAKNKLRNMSLAAKHINKINL